MNCPYPESPKKNLPFPYSVCRHPPPQWVNFSSTVEVWTSIWWMPAPGTTQNPLEYDRPGHAKPVLPLRASLHQSRQRWVVLFPGSLRIGATRTSLSKIKPSFVVHTYCRDMVLGTEHKKHIYLDILLFLKF